VVRAEPATVARLKALVGGDEVFATRFGIPVVPGWAGFPEALPRLLATVQADGPSAWGTHLSFDDDGDLVGLGGWKGEPVDGAAELGYALAPTASSEAWPPPPSASWWPRAQAAGLRLVLAHTLPHESASTSVLRRCGFVQTVPPDPEPDAAWRWELRPAAPAKLNELS